MDYTPHNITATAFSHPSRDNLSSDLRLAVGRSNGDIELWDPKHNWSHELTLSGARGRSIEGLCWATKDGEQPRLFSIGGSTYVTEWDLSSGLAKINYDCNAVIWSLAVDKSGDKLAIGCDDGLVVIIDISGGFGSLEPHSFCQRQDLRVLCLKWYNDIIIGGCADARIRCWHQGRIVSSMRVDKSKTESTLVWCINVLPKRQQLVSGDSTGSIKVWDLNNYTLLQGFTPHTADVLTIVSDSAEEKFFTAGVDRKIHEFSLVALKNSKWVHSSNRLLHSNDVRSMSIYESKSYNLLVSGGVEKTIVVQLVTQFHDGAYRKLLPHENLLVTNKGLIIKWQDQEIKLWQLGDRYRLVGKLILKDDENITDVGINQAQNLLAVLTAYSVKVFTLYSTPKKLKITKIKDDNFKVNGAKRVIVYDDNLLVLSRDEELNLYKIGDTISLVREIDDNDFPISNRLPYLNNIKRIVINNTNDKLAIARFNGVIEIMSLISDEKYILTNLASNLPYSITFTDNQTLVVLAEDNKIYEFNLTGELLTSWSKRNSEFLPKQFLSLTDKPRGMYIEQQKLWVYGENFLCFFDLSLNIPINKAYKNISIKKRKRDGLTIDDDDDTINDNMEMSLRQSQISKLKIDTAEDELPFWLTSKYNHIVYCGKYGADLIIIQPPSIKNPPSIQLPKLQL